MYILPGKSGGHNRPDITRLLRPCQKRSDLLIKLGTYFLFRKNYPIIVLLFFSLGHRFNNESLFHDAKTYERKNPGSIS